MRDIWTRWDWQREPEAPRTWTDPERRVVIVEGLLAAGAASAIAFRALGMPVPRAVVVAVETADFWARYADYMRPYGAAQIAPEVIPALRIERQADLSPAALRALLSVAAPHRALVVSPREAIDVREAVACQWTDGPEKTRPALPAPVTFRAARLARPVDLMIVEGPTGPDAWPMHPAWIRKLRDDCASAGVAFAFTGWGAWVPNADNRVCERRVVDGVEFCQVGKIGHEQRLLDGVEHLALPEGL